MFVVDFVFCSPLLALSDNNQTVVFVCSLFSLSEFSEHGVQQVIGPFVASYTHVLNHA